MPVEYFFPTPIYFAIVENIDSIQKEVSEYVSTLHGARLVNPWGDTVSTTFKYGNYEHVLSETPILLEEIKKHCREFLIRLNYSNLNINVRESWCNIGGEHSFQHYHLHGDSDMSGVYYHQTSGDDGDIVFRNPSLVNRFHKLTYNIDNAVNYKPEVGKILLFPSFLEHAVFHNNTCHKRISLSFNITLSQNERKL